MAYIEYASITDHLCLLNPFDLRLPLHLDSPIQKRLGKDSSFRPIVFLFPHRIFGKLPDMPNVVLYRTIRILAK